MGNPAGVTQPCTPVATINRSSIYQLGKSGILYPNVNVHPRITKAMREAFTITESKAFSSWRTNTQGDAVNRAKRRA